MLNLDVLSFQLLAYRVMDELGMKKPAILDETGKSIFLRRACQEVKKELQVYREKLRTQGFINQMKMLFSEFCQYSVSRERLEQAAEQTDSALLRGKLHDVQLIWERFQADLEGNAALPEEIPQILLKALPHSTLLNDAVLVFDGYTGFTPLQLQIISHILTSAKSVGFSVSIPIDANPYKRELGEAAIADLWWLGKENIAKIVTCADRLSVQKGDDVLFSKKLHHPAITLLRAEDPTEEVRAVVRHIRKETLQSGDKAQVRYRSIAVAVTDAARYQEIIRREFGKAGIPYFMDDKSDSTGSAVVELLRAVLAVISGGYRYDDVIRYARNPLLLAGISNFAKSPADAEAKTALADVLIAEKTEEKNERKGKERTDACDAANADAGNMQETKVRELCDCFDNYLRAKGIRGRKRFSDNFSSTYRGAENLNLQELNAYKDALLAPVFQLHDELALCKETGARSKALLSYLEALPLSSCVHVFAEKMRAEGLSREAEENERFAFLVPDFLKRLCVLFRDETTNLKEFCELIDAGFTDMKAGMIPQKLDMLLIGDLKRSRFDDIDTLYLLGANDGLLPSVVSGGGLLTDEERVSLQQCGVDMAPADRLDSCIQRYYLYLLLNKPRRKLYLSFSHMNRDGREQKPSVIIREIREARSELYVQQAEKDEIVGTVDDELRLFASEIRKQAFALLRMETEHEPDGPKTEAEQKAQNRFLERFHFLKNNPETAAQTKQLLEAGFYRHTCGKLPEQAAARLYGDPLYGSVTRFERYERCPYAHFLQYGLGLLERQQYDVEAQDIGTLYHSAIDLVFRKLADAGEKLEDVSQERLSALAAASVEEAVSDYHDNVMLSSARNRYLCKKVGTITKRTIWALQKQLLQGDFRLAGCEVPFRHKEAHLELHGRIDRVDTYEEPSKIYVRVIDYKSGTARFDLSMVYQGLQLQLVTYMNLALSRAQLPGKEALPAGMFYYHISDPLVTYQPEWGKMAGPSAALKTDSEKALPTEEAAENKASESTENEAPQAQETAQADPKLQEAITTEVLSELRMNGIANEDREMLSHLDRGFSGGAAYTSQVMPVRVGKSGGIDARSQTANTARFGALLRYAANRLKQDTAQILAGDIDAHPYLRMQGNERKTGCDYCPYHSICGFDQRIAGFSYRNVYQIPDYTVWDELCKKCGEKQDKSEDEMDVGTKTGN